jgi:hypothetical protein
MFLRCVPLRVVADNKKPQPELGASFGLNETHTYTLAEEEETASDVSVSLFLWLKYAEPVQTLGKSVCVEP